jgi:FkbM family methyltransferase
MWSCAKRNVLYSRASSGRVANSHIAVLPRMNKTRLKESLLVGLKNFVESRGFLVRRRDRIGGDPFIDMARLAGGNSPLIFDVGANVGQSIEKFRSLFADPVIHSFEPGLESFSILRSKYRGTPGIAALNNFGLGSRDETRELIENSISRMSSFLEPGRDCFGAVVAREVREIRSLDSYSIERGISHIDILKTDTQGFDLEVVKGSEKMIRGHRIHLLLVELTFMQLYQNAPRVDELLKFILDRGLELISTYEVIHRNNRAGETDALFVDPQFLKPVLYQEDSTFA